MLGNRATRVSKQLNLPNIRIVELNLQDHLFRPNPRHMRMETFSAMAADSVAEPVLESSGEEVKVTVHSKVYLKAE